MCEHGGALEYDLLTKTRYTLDDIGGALSYRALRHFVQYMGADCALWLELHPDEAEMVAWEQGRMDAVLLADVFDAVNAMGSRIAGIMTGRHRRPKPYPRPWDKRKSTTHVGGTPMRIGDFDAWWEESITGR